MQARPATAEIDAQLASCETEPQGRNRTEEHHNHRPTPRGAAAAPGRQLTTRVTSQAVNVSLVTSDRVKPSVAMTRSWTV